MRASRVFILPALLAATVLLHAGFNPETGDYVLQRYSAKQYGASPQNWGVTQDRRGVMYFANTDSLLEFDGTWWRKIGLPGGQTARTVNTDDRGTVYVGGVGEFGRLGPDSSGTMQYVSLLSHVPREDRAFLDVWRILPTPKGVYFSSFSRLLRLNPDGTIKVWRPQKRFAKAFYVLNTLYVTSSGIGLMKMGSDDKLVPAPGGDRFANDAVQVAVPYGGNALIATNSHLYRFSSSGGAELFPTAADSHLAASLVYSMLAFPDGEIAVGTRKGGLVLLNPAGSVDRIFSTANGLPDDLVTAIYADPQHGIWLTSNNGITRVDPALTSFGKVEGLAGDVQVTARHQGLFFAGTTAGLFRLNAHAGLQPKFERIDGIDSTSMWALKSDGNDLLAATNLGVFQVSGNHATRIFESTRTVFDVSVSRRDPSTLYVARLTAVTVLNRKGSSWTKAAEFDAAGEEFRSVLEDADGRVWATTKGGVWQFDFREKPIRSEKFGLDHGIPAGWVNARGLNGHIVFTTAKGLLRYDDAHKSFVPDTSLGKEFSDGREVEDIWDDASGNVWVTGAGYHGALLRENGGYKWSAMPLLHSGIKEIWSMTLDPDGVAWATGDDFVLHRWERAVGGNPDQDFHVLTRRVQVAGEKGNWYGGAGKVPAAKLPWKNYELRFEFAAPFYEEPAAVEYQVRLAGSDENWTPWSYETSRNYTHLPEGAYRLQVRARTPHGAIAEDSSLDFGVLPPWYRTWWAYTLYAIFGGFGVWGIVRWRTSQLEEDKRKLEVIVEERTVEVRQQRDEIQVQEQKSQALLLNILPAKVADELKSTGAVEPVAFEDVTVCFTDFVGFTVSSEKMAAGTLVNALNEYFTRFDEIIARYQLEKLKTIGDSYMFVSGLPAKRSSHAVDAVMAALEMVEVVKELGAREGGTGWNIRVGLHSGPVVAGVVGIRKFAFDIWGNTVNFAARMESSGVPGRVNMSERTSRLLRGLIECESRGHVKIKEGRELPMYLAEGPARELVYGEVVEGIPAAFAARYREEFEEDPRSFAAVKPAVAVMAGQA